MRRSVALCLLSIVFAGAFALCASEQPGGRKVIPWDEIGAKASGMCDGRGLEIDPVADGIHLNCSYQQIGATATRGGLWLALLADNGKAARLRIMAAAVNGRALAPVGEVGRNGGLVRYTRGVVAEEYSTSVDGIRQDFVVMERPADNGMLRLLLAVEGVPARQNGAAVSLDLPAARLVYHKLHVTDAQGRVLPASMRATGPDIEITVDDAGAAYPVRVDPTFSNANWSGMNTGVPGVGTFGDGVFAMAVDSKGVIYVGGQFNLAGGVVVNNIAKWDGSKWSEVDSRGISGDVYALATSGTTLYAGGNLTAAGGVSVNRIAKWSAGAWSPLGDGVNGTVLALAVSGSTVYAGGWFDMAGGVAATNIAKWNGSAWSSLNGGVDGEVRAMVYYNSALYVGGSFKKAGSITVNNVAKWSSNTWSALGSVTKGVNGVVNALAASSNYLYVGGSFDAADGGSASNIARWHWTNSAWSALGSGADGEVSALALSGAGVLFVGGSFTEAGGNSANNIARWSGSAWSAMGSGTDNAVCAMALSGANLYAAGYFFDAGGTVASLVARWNDNAKTWNAMGGGINDVVYSVVAKSGKVYIGGSFRTAGTAETGFLAEWRNGAWRTVGGGLDGTVRAMLVAGDDLFVAGAFGMAGAVEARNIARWDGSAWHALGDGCGDENSAVLALAMVGGNLYAGGDFAEAGGVEVNNVAKWNGAQWSALADGVNGWVYALMAHAGKLCAAGELTAAGGVPAGKIAYWDDTAGTWSAMGDGLDTEYGDGAVLCLAVGGSGRLFAGGTFNRSGETPLNNIAQWVGGAWQPLGDGVNGTVQTMIYLSDSIFAGGDFTVAGENSVNSVAAWDGVEWVSVGDGVAGDGGGGHKMPYAMSAEGTVVYVGGDFYTAGDKSAVYMARLDLVVRPEITISADSSNIVVRWPSSVDAGFMLEETSSLAAPQQWSACNEPVSVSDGYRFVTMAASGGKKFFRLRLPQ